LYLRVLWMHSTSVFLVSGSRLPTRTTRRRESDDKLNLVTVSDTQRQVAVHALRLSLKAAMLERPDLMAQAAPCP